MESESLQKCVLDETMHDEDETVDVTTMVARLDSIENTMHLVLDQIKGLT